MVKNTDELQQALMDTPNLERFLKENEASFKNQNLTQVYKLCIREFQGHEAIYSPPGCDADIEKGSEGGCGSFRNTLVQYQIGAGPEAYCLLKRAVAEKCQHDLLCTWDLYDILQRKWF